MGDDAGDKEEATSPEARDRQLAHEQLAKAQGSNSKAAHGKQKSTDHKQPLINPWTPQGNVNKNMQKAE